MNRTISRVEPSEGVFYSSGQVFDHCGLTAQVAVMIGYE